MTNNNQMTENDLMPDNNKIPSNNKMTNTGKMTRSIRTRAMTEGALMVALATALGFIKLFELPQGGSISVCMLPLFLYNTRWGARQSFKCTFAFGLLQLILDGAYAWGPFSMLLDYILAFGILGVSGLFKRTRVGMTTGILVSCFLRFLIHFISGITIYRIFEPTELFNMTMTDPYIYSAVYNGSFMAIDTILCLAVILILYKPLHTYIEGRDLGKH